jgi:hypothetical protein
LHTEQQIRHAVTETAAAITEVEEMTVDVVALAAQLAAGG